MSHDKIPTIIFQCIQDYKFPLQSRELHSQSCRPLKFIRLPKTALALVLTIFTIGELKVHVNSTKLYHAYLHANDYTESVRPINLQL